MVVGVDERVDLGLQLRDCRGRWLGAEPFFHCLLESFDLAACCWVVGSRVLLADAVFDEFGFESVAAGAAQVGEPGGEHQTVVGQRRERNPMQLDAIPERGDHDHSGDGPVRGH